MTGSLGDSLEARASELDPSVRELFLEPFASKAQVRASCESAIKTLQTAPSMVPLAEVERGLATHPSIANYLGRFYRAFAAEGSVSELYLPYDWDETERDLGDVVERVVNISAHWNQNHGSSPELFFALLAEIEGFRWLLANFDRVEALCFEPRTGGSAPEARTWRQDQAYLFEIKSVGAYALLAHNDIQRLARDPTTVAIPAGAAAEPNLGYVFGGRGRKQAHARLGRRNVRVLREQLARLLSDAVHQLTTYAELHPVDEYRPGVILVVTQSKAVLGVLHVGRDLAADWLQRHAADALGVWLSGGDAKIIHGSLP